MKKYSNNYIKALFEGFDKKKILVIGDVMLDAYLWGKVERISPEAPVPIVSIRKKDFRLGGAANVAMNIKALGAEPLLFSVIGTGSNGAIFRSILRDAGISDHHLIANEERPTTIKTRVMAGHQQMIRIDEEIIDDIDGVCESELIQSILAKLPQCDAVIFEDYDKGVIHQRVIKTIIEAAKNQGKPVVVDPKRNNFLHYTGVTLMKPNLKELKEGLRIDLPANFNLDFVKQTAKDLREKLSLEYALITLSENGLYLGTDNQDVHVDAHLRDIFDVSGAGDTVISVTALLLVGGASIELIAEISNLAGGLVCEKVGVVPVDKQLLLEESLKVLAN